jgi:hypothetical protein
MDTSAPVLRSFSEVGSFVTFVFKIRIRDHPSNPREKTMPADVLATKECTKKPAVGESFL